MVSEEKRVLIREMLNTYINTIKKDDEIFSNSLKKWKNLILNLSYKNSLKTNIPLEDFFQDVMLHLVEANARYNFNFYRYNGKLYEIIFKDNDYVYLKSNPFNKKEKNQILVDRKEVEQVQKGKHASFIYRRLNQFCFEAVTSHFTKKNGYDMTTEEGFVVTRSGRSERKLEKKTLNKPIKMYHTSTYEDLSEMKIANTPSPEELLIVDDIYAKGIMKLSEKSKKSLDKYLGMYYDIPMPDSSIMKKAILRELDDNNYTKSPVYFEEIIL